MQFCCSYECVCVWVRACASLSLLFFGRCYQTEKLSAYVIFIFMGAIV